MNKTLIDNDCMTALTELQELDCLLLELQLYLDIHSKDEQAIKEFNDTVRRRAQLADSFDKKYGPHQQYGHAHHIDEVMNWLRYTWPWQTKEEIYTGPERKN